MHYKIHSSSLKKLSLHLEYFCENKREFTYSKLEPGIQFLRIRSGSVRKVGSGHGCLGGRAHWSILRFRWSWCSRWRCRKLPTDSWRRGSTLLSCWSRYILMEGCCRRGRRRYTCSNHSERSHRYTWYCSQAPRTVPEGRSDPCICKHLQGKEKIHCQKQILAMPWYQNNGKELGIIYGKLKHFLLYYHYLHLYHGIQYLCNY